jgi:hypothetical protein
MTSERWQYFIENVPKSHSFIDFAGNDRTFTFSGSEGHSSGYFVVAKEDLPNGSKDVGYEFSAVSHASPDEAFAKLTNKVRTAITVRHLDPRTTEPSLLAARATGRVGYGGVVVDGVFIDWASFTKLAQAYEGWEFELAFSS